MNSQFVTDQPTDSDLKSCMHATKDWFSCLAFMIFGLFRLLPLWFGDLESHALVHVSTAEYSEHTRY